MRTDREINTISMPITIALSGLVSNATNSCNGKVRVCSGLSPANVIVAPNSPSALAQERAMPANIEFRNIGRVTVKKVLIGVAPKFRDASSSFESSSLADDSMDKTKKGSATNVAAIIAPAVVNGRVIPSQLFNFSPMKPFLPSANSNAVPPATGGRTIGRRTTALTIFSPLNLALAKIQPSGIPKITQMQAELVAIIIERLMDRRTVSSVAI
tara:strand:- start:20 stop:658 length:639 start_codon:yes stop_codon:yes gene_type:complete